MNAKRHNYPWTVNECIQLQREYELLGLPIHEIATKHNRSHNAILYKIKQEGFIQEEDDYIIQEKNKQDFENLISVLKKSENPNIESQIMEIKKDIKSISNKLQSCSELMGLSRLSSL